MLALPQRVGPAFQDCQGSGPTQAGPLDHRGKGFSDNMEAFAHLGCLMRLSSAAQTILTLLTPGRPAAAHHPTQAALEPCGAWIFDTRSISLEKLPCVS